MKIQRTPVLWGIFFILCFILFSEIAQQYIEPREIVISREEAVIIGKKIWQNEGRGAYENLIVWNNSENFPSLGIGHFIWYPEGEDQRYEETFPNLIKHISKTRDIPHWLQSQQFPPWKSRDEFLENSDSDFSRKLRRFLQDTTAEQTQFIIARLEAALPKILKNIKSGFVRESVRRNFYQVSMQKNGVYALVDYVNFKGEGISPKERYNNQGWGLLQVLRNMDHNEENPLKAFVRSADQRLTRRVANAPADESQWLPIWRRRLQTYAN